MARVVRFHEYGDADVLKIEDVDVAAPDADEVQIEVRAIGLNRAEVIFAATPMSNRHSCPADWATKRLVSSKRLARRCAISVRASR
ncbi:hypothetical protein ABIF66_002570 [Bradyrhizobium japonicum]